MKARQVVLLLVVTLVVGVAGVVKNAVSTPSISIEVRYEYTKQVRMFEALNAALKDSFTPEQRSIIERINKQAPLVDAKRAEMAKACGSYELAYGDTGEPYCKKKGK